MAADLSLLVGLTYLSAPIWAILAYALGGPSRGSRWKWAGFALLFWPTALLVVFRRLRGRTADNEPLATLGDMPKPRARPVHPIPPVAAADLEGVPEPVEACPDCGFLGIRPPGIQDGVWPGGGELVLQVCPRCGYRGLPVTFSKREDYGEFLEQLAAPDPPSPGPA